MHATLPLLTTGDFPALQRTRLETLQVNLGYRCNQSCLHCHVNAGPNRKEEMDDDTLEAVLAALPRSGAGTLDLTGGAPELHPRFRLLVSRARALGVEVIDRCNLTVLLQPGQADTADFLAGHQVRIVASLPCYLESNVDAQRGAGVFHDSIAALQRLNRLGYGQPDSGLVLDLVFNPQGPDLPPAQQALEADYRKQLAVHYGIRFNRLLVLVNMPILRFGSTLVSRGQFTSYLNLLRGAHRAENLEHVMCRSLVSVDWRGYLYDCDFNQMLDLPVLDGARRPLHVTDLDRHTLEQRAIRVAAHCYGCTAGQGSSCGGALATESLQESA